MLRLPMVLFAMALLARVAAAQCSGQWLSGPDQGTEGTDNTVSTLVSWDPDGPGPQPAMLLAAGAFQYVGTLQVSGTAAWTGTTWQPMFGPPIAQTAFIVLDGNLYASDQSASTGADLTRWSGAAWTPLSGGGPTNALTDFSGSIIAGGAYYDAPDSTRIFGIASWDGSAWHALGSGLAGYEVCCDSETGQPFHVDPYVSLMAVYNGWLYVYGSFALDGQTYSFARWNGSVWQGLDSSLSFSSMTVFNGELIVAGEFTSIFGVPANNIARWDGFSWHALGSGLTGPSSHRAQILTTFNGSLIVGGLFEAADGMSASNIAAWDGQAWTPLGEGFNSYPTAAAVLNGNLYVSGDFSMSGEVITTRLARWDGTEWRPLGSGVNAPPAAFTIWTPPGSLGPRLYAGGSFNETGTTRVDNVAQWDGVSWAPLGWGTDGSIFALTLWDPDGPGPTPPQLVAGGSFEHTGADSTGQVDTSLIALWDGQAWSSVGEGLGTGADTNVTALAVYNGDLIAAGQFATTTTGVPVHYIARWDGTEWRPLGPGLLSYVLSLAVYNGELYAGGSFIISGADPLLRIARWDGSNWHDVGGGMNNDALGQVRALAVYGGELVVAGRFNFAGPVPTNSIAAWNGFSWRSLGYGMTDDNEVAAGIDSLCIYNGDLVAGGYFTRADHAPCNNLARWNGAGWSPIGLGADGDVNSLASYNDELIAAGNFHTVSDTVNGQQLSIHWARWRDAGCCGSADFNHDGDVATDADIEDFFACLAGNCCPTCGSADFNGDGDSATDADIEAFFRVLAGGSC